MGSLAEKRQIYYDQIEISAGNSEGRNSGNSRNILYNLAYPNESANIFSNLTEKFIAHGSLYSGEQQGRSLILKDSYPEAVVFLTAASTASWIAPLVAIIF